MECAFSVLSSLPVSFCTRWTSETRKLHDDSAEGWSVAKTKHEWELQRTVRLMAEHSDVLRAKLVEDGASWTRWSKSSIGETRREGSRIRMSVFEGLDRFVGHLPGRYETLGREIERLAAQHERLAKLTRRRRGGLHRRRRRRSQNNAAKATARRRPRRALKAVKDDRVSAPARACVKEERAEAQHRCDTAERELEDARDRVLRVVRTEPDAPRQILFLPSISSCVRRAVIRSKGQTTCPFCNGRHRPAHPNYELKLEPGFLV